MKILFSSLGSHGHTYPLIPLAAAARDLGHEVLYVTSAAFGPVLERVGVEHLTGGPELGAAFAEATTGLDAEGPREIPPEMLARIFGYLLPRGFALDLKPIIADRRPDLVVHEVGNPGAGMAAQVAGLPALCHGFGRVWTGDDDLVRHAAGLIAQVADELGAKAPGNDPMLMGNPYLDICPPSVQAPEFLASTERIELRPVPFAEPGELPAWVTGHREPLVYLTLGTAFGDVEVLRTAIGGLAGLGARVLVAAGPTVSTEVLGEVPDDVVVLPWVPQADLLPHVDLVVHHGGSGTTMGSFGAGVPQLLLPQGADQFSNAAAVTEAGLGDRLLGGQVTAEAVAEKARRLLADEAVREAARAIAAEVAAMPSPHEVAATLPRYA
ncbi:glycosyltransferase [Saccharothrix lopnurensis]|uniref:Glycosyltransferase n=1 Tax=Saccharothrix lopnurensis TaxID=1670621 RepID=A0ABW1PHS8_9PSEU